MKWGRENDYHGSRSYGADVPELNRPSLLLDWLVSIVKRRLRGGRPKSAPARRLGDETFTWLGASSSRISRGGQPFPAANTRNYDVRNSASRLRNEN